MKKKIKVVQLYMLLIQKNDLNNQSKILISFRVIQKIQLLNVILIYHQSNNQFTINFKDLNQKMNQSKENYLDNKIFIETFSQNLNNQQKVKNLLQLSNI